MDMARSEFIARLKDMPCEYAEVATKAFDFILHNYDVTKKETALSTVVNQMPREVSIYRDCKIVEGQSKNGVRNRLILINSFLLYVGKPLSEITANDVRAFLYEYQEQRGIKDNTLDRYRSYLSSFFAWCLEEEIITKDPTKNIKKIRYEQERRTSLTQVELEYLRNSCRTMREKLIVEMLYSTGCRVSELSNMKLSDINVETGTAIVHGKGKKIREVYLNAKAIVAIKMWTDARKDGCEYLLVARGNCQMSTRAIQREISVIAGRTPLTKHITPHVFRHTFATVGLQNGMELAVLKTALGHESADTTLIYADISNNKVHEEHKRCVI